MALATSTAILIGAGLLATGGIAATAIGSSNQAKAGQAIAQAQQIEAKNQRDTAIAAANQAISQAAPTAGELSSIERQIQLYEKMNQLQGAALARQEELANSLDPALKEAGSQAYALLQGREAAILAPIRRQRELQRQRLEAQLVSRLGSGYATSTAGIQALNSFDSQTDMLMAQAQDQATGRLLQTSVAARPDLVGDITRAGTMMGGLSQGIFAANNALADRNYNAQSNLINAINGNSLVPYAGAENIGQMLAGQAWAAMGNQLAAGGAGVLSSYAGNAAFGSSQRMTGEDIFGSIPATAPAPSPYKSWGK